MYSTLLLKKQQRGDRVPCIDDESIIGYEQRIHAKLSLQNVRRICLTGIQELLNLVSGNGRRGSTAVAPQTGKKGYQAPVARKLTPEQAKLLLVGHATVGDQGAKELMELVFPEPSKFSETRDESVSPIR